MSEGGGDLHGHETDAADAGNGETLGFLQGVGGEC